MTLRSLSMLLLTAVVLGPSPTAAAPAASRVLLGLHDGGVADAGDLGPLDRFVLGWQLADLAAMANSLEEEGWDDHLRFWMSGRLARRAGKLDAVTPAMAQARAAWPDSSDLEVVRAAFDREHLSWLLTQGDLAKARELRNSPLAEHAEDPRWSALGAELIRRRGLDARERFDEAWERAESLDRRDPIFLARALAHLAAADSQRAAVIWVETVLDLRRPEELRASAAVWDAEPGLREAVRRDARVMEESLSWLVRLFRRDEALEYARSALAGSVATETQRAALFVFGAEQLYRLRRHDALATWLAQSQPDSLDAEQRASLEAYPWGVRRRSGPRLEIARGFDAVAARYAGTDRAAEAVWESAWMWELCDQPDSARSRFEAYAGLRPRGAYAEAAALRAILLPYLASDPEAALQAYDRIGTALGDGMNQAAALFLRARSLDRLGRANEAQLVRDRLRAEHPASPFWRTLTHPWRQPARRSMAPSEVLTALHRTQWEAFLKVGESLGIGDPLADLPPALSGLRRLLDLGLADEAEGRLLEYGRSRLGDDAALLRATAVAWATGSPEIQARLGYLLELRLAGESEELDHALQAVARPTPFAPTVLAISDEIGLPAGLVWSLMRRESFYDADVVSLAGAYGLLQLLPTTAGRMARKVGDEAPAPAELFEPGRNLRLGMAYLRQLLDESAGDVSQALAAYNAGEANGARWAGRRPSDELPTFMILQISYSETRAYVYHVLRQWWVGLDAYPELARWDGLDES